MALVNLATSVTFSFVDESASKSSMQVSAAAGTTLADLRTAANALVPLLEAASDCSCTGYNITATTIETDLPVPAAGSRVERKGNFDFRTAAGKLASVSVPGIIGSAVQAGGRVDEDNAAVAALLVALQATPWTDSNGSDLGILVNTYESYRKTSRRQLPTGRRPDGNTTAGDDSGI